MAHAAVHWVINEVSFPAGVKPPARWLMVHIADRADRDTWDCYPSHKTLAKDAGMSPRTVLDLLFVLESAALITRTPRFREDGKRSTDLISLNSGYATIAVPDGNIGPDRPQHPTSESANVAALNPVSEPGKRTDVVLRVPDPFEAWWDAYPRKVAKVAARKAWAKMAPQISALGLEELMRRTSAFAESVLHREPEHIAHPATWLNGERWNDELSPHRSQTDGQPTGHAGPSDRAAQRQRSVIEPMFAGAEEALARRRRWTLGG